MGRDNSSLLPTLLDGLKDHILSFGENEMHIAYPVQSIKAFRSVYIALKLRILTVFLCSYKIVEGWDLRHWCLHIFTKQHRKFFTCPCSLNFVLLNGNLFTVDLQDYFVLPSKLFSNSQYCTVLRLLQEYCIAIATQFPVRNYTPNHHNNDKGALR